MFIRMMLVFLVCFLAMDNVSVQSAPAASGIDVLGSSTLKKTALAAGMQGRSGIVLDVNGDGVDDLLVGIPEAGPKGTKGGFIVYSRFRSFLAPVVKGEGNFGWRMAALGDVNGDGKGDFAVSALNGSGPNVSLAGTVTVYHGDAIPQAARLIEGENALDRFGYSLASGDLNGDGVKDLVVGAPFYSPDPALFQQGAVHVYFGPQYDPASSVQIPATATMTGLGYSVATGDVNNDGIDDLLMGASGKTLACYGVRGTFAPSAPDAVFSSLDSEFGRSIAVLWDLDGDGFKDIAIGAPACLVGTSVASGRLSIVKGGAGLRTVNVDAPSADILARIDGEATSGRFATALCLLGDIDGDGTPELAASAEHGDGSAHPMTGKVYVFSGKTLASGPTTASATAIAGEGGSMHLGAFLATTRRGKQLIAGAPTDNLNMGCVKVYQLGIQP